MDEGYLDTGDRSAFKAGLSWLREVVTPALRDMPVARVRISYARFEGEGDHGYADPLVAGAVSGPELLARDLGIALDAIEVVEAGGRDPLLVAEAFDADGAALGRWECSPPHVVQPFIDAIPDSGLVVAPAGQIVIHCPDGETRRIEVATDLQSFWGFWQERVIPRLLAHIDALGGPHAAAQPFFGELLAEVWISEPNEALGIREENDSAAEALAEDIYFTTLDAIELYGNQQTGERATPRRDRAAGASSSPASRRAPASPCVPRLPAPTCRVRSCASMRCGWTATSWSCRSWPRSLARAT